MIDKLRDIQWSGWVETFRFAFGPELTKAAIRSGLCCTGKSRYRRLIKVMTGGVFIGKGMKVGIPTGGLVLTLGPDGRLAGQLTLHVAYDVVPVWFKIARQNLSAVEAAEVVRKAAWETDDEDAKMCSLEEECAVSMQCIMAVAIALDALYSQIKSRVPSITAELVQTWHRNKTPRYAQVFEVLQRGLKPDNAYRKNLRGFLKDAFKLRDFAVHPHAEMRAPVLHPELGIMIEGRFASFRAENARICANSLESIILDLAAISKPTTEVAAYMTSLREIANH